MKKGKRSWGKQSLIGFLCFSIILATSGCGVQKASEEARNITNYDGITLFEGLLFGSGPVAGLFPEVWQDPAVKTNMEKLTESERADIEVGKLALINDIKKQDTTFFDRFAKDIQSGNPVKVEAIMDETLEHIMYYAEKNNKLPEGQIAPQVCGPTLCAVAIAIVVVFGNYLAVAHSVAVALAIWLKVGVTKSTAPSSQTGITKDMYIATVTERLAVIPR